MNSLRKKLDKLKPQFSEGGRFAKLRSVFEGFESFMFVSDKVTFRGIACQGPHRSQAGDVGCDHRADPRTFIWSL